MTNPDTIPQTATILIIDDNWMNRELLRTLLETEAFAVIEASNGAKGLSLARSQYPAVIILDVRMPDLDGYEVCRQIKNDPTTKLIPVIMMSGLDDAREKQAAREAGAVTLLSRFKPLNEIIAIIRQQLPE